MNSADVRAQLVYALRDDLIGPDPDDPRDAAHQTETLETAPSHWYLTGFLAPPARKVRTRKIRKPVKSFSRVWTTPQTASPRRQLLVARSNPFVGLGQGPRTNTRSFCLRMAGNRSITDLKTRMGWRFALYFGKYLRASTNSFPRALSTQPSS